MSEELERFFEWLEEHLDKYGESPLGEMTQADREFLKKLLAGLAACLQYKDDTYVNRLQQMFLAK